MVLYIDTGNYLKSIRGRRQQNISFSERKMIFKKASICSCKRGKKRKANKIPSGDQRA